MKLFDGTLPIRRWLALALIATFLVPVIVTIIAGAAEFGSSWHSAGQAEQTLRTGVSQWNDPAWRRATQRSLAAQGMTFVLQEGGRTIYRSSRDTFSSSGINNQVSVQRLVIPGAREQRVAYVYSRPFGPGFAGGGFLFAPLLGLIALLLTLSAIAWFLRRTLIVPLAATSRAARRIAGGDLDIALPDSRIDEVAELKTAFLVMNSELRTSLQHQAAIEEERRLFVSAIAHDLRTPLFSLRGYLEGLEQGLANTPQKMAHYIRICRDKADALERLIADLFAYTRSEYLDQTLQRQSLDLGELLNKIVDGRRREAERKRVELQVDGLRHGCMVEGDPQLLERAVENLLDNALRYAPDGGAIGLRWRVNGSRTEFSVFDTGPGIARHDLAHLFEPMYRADVSRSRETGGSGLGLAIARRILRAHGGDLVAANRETGGAEFTGSLPLGPHVPGGPAPVLSGSRDYPRT